MSAPCRLVIDTNVVMDLLHFDDPQSRPLRAALAAGSVVCYANAATLAELARVVGYPAFALSAEAGERLCAEYQALAQRHDAATPIEPLLPRCSDRDDQMFLELAARTGAVWLISKDKALLKLARKTATRFRIARPEQFVTWLATPAS
jgi:uncharacterized protein